MKIKKWLKSRNRKNTLSENKVADLRKGRSAGKKTQHTKTQKYAKLPWR